jgi:hypothetical protein
VAGKLNKKVLCFIDEHGTAGAGALHMGAVLVLAREAGRIDKAFSDALEPTANEIHATTLDDHYLHDLMTRFWVAAPEGMLVITNQRIAPSGGAPPILYAKAVIEAVKAGLKCFQAEVLGRNTIGNVDLIIDCNHHNELPAFDAEIGMAQRLDGRFRAVKRVARLDSAASRLLQLADIVAYSRKWVTNGTFNARTLQARFGIRMP